MTANPTFEAVETLAKALFEAAGDYECTWDEARDSIGQGIFFDVARAILTGSITLPGLVPAAQVAEAVAKERANWMANVDTTIPTDMLEFGQRHGLGETIKNVWENGFQNGSRKISEAVAAEREACARIARHGCLVPPDGGSPSQSEVDLCHHIATVILERGQPMPPFAEIRERGEA